MNIIKASDNVIFFSKAEQFVLPYEKGCCALMQRILSHDDSVYIIAENNAAKEIRGVISFTAGRVLFHCLPDKSDEVLVCLTEFCRNKNIFCITGLTEGTDFVEKAIFAATGKIASEQRDYYFMEFSNAFDKNKIDLIPEIYNVHLQKCSSSHIEQLLPLHLDYVRVEVLAEGRKLNADAERKSLETILKEQHVFALAKGNDIAAKAQTNALGKNHIQIGGVYTLPAYRGQGFATYLVNYIACSARAKCKEAVLFVKVKNISALHAYENAGFSIQGDFRISYYNN